MTRIMDQPLPLSAEDIGRRVVRLVEHVRDPDDLSPAHIEQFTGTPVAFNLGNAGEYGFGDRLTDTWADTLKPSRVMFSFDDESRSHADMAPIRALDFDGYASTLGAAGYRARPARRTRDTPLPLRGASFRLPGRRPQARADLR